MVGSKQLSIRHPYIREVNFWVYGTLAGLAQAEGLIRENTRDPLWDGKGKESELADGLQRPAWEISIWNDGQKGAIIDSCK